MLPKIPYKMEKNKSQSIPIGNFNRSCNFQPGDIVDSCGISSRKYPYLTTKKGNYKMDLTSSGYEDYKIEAMTVFGGEIATVRKNDRFEKALFIGNEFVCELEDLGGSEKQLAVINTKIVVYPDKIYVERVGDQWVVAELGAEVILSSLKTEFFSNRIQANGKKTKYSQIYFDTTNRAIVIPSIKKSYNTAGRSNLFYFGDGTYSQLKKLKPEGSEFGELEYYYDKGNVYVYLPKGTTVPAGRVAFQNTSSLEWFHGKITGRTDNTDWDYTLLNVSCEQDADKGWAFFYYQDDEFEDIWNFSEFAHVGEFCVFEGMLNKEDCLNYGTIEEVSRNTLKLTGYQENSYGPIWSQTFYISDPDSSAFNNISNQAEISVVGSTKNTGVFTVTRVKGDKIYLDNVANLNDELVQNGAINVFSDEPKFSDFKVGDCVAVSGCKFNGNEDGEDNDLSFVISKIKNSAIYTSADIFTEGISIADVTIERKIPDLDFICEKDNRLYGVSNKDKTIYVSALGDPTNMYAYEGVSTDSFAVAVGGEGDFTACCKYSDAVLFFKEEKLYKLVGSYPAEFALYSYDVPGVSEGGEKSCVIINGVLYYCGRDGIYAYTGGVPTLISENFGEFHFSDPVGGKDGECYFVSLSNDDADDDFYLFSYNTRFGLWVLEDRYIRYTDSAEFHGDLIYLNEDGEVFELNWDPNPWQGEWFVQFAPFYETMDGKKIYSRLVFRVEIPRGSHMIIEVRSDDSTWREAGKIVGRGQAVIPIRLPIARCDKFEIKLSGRGECTILDIMREFYVGSEV